MRSRPAARAARPDACSAIAAGDAAASPLLSGGESETAPPRNRENPSAGTRRRLTLARGARARGATPAAGSVFG
jgi:hypothetical protein